VRASKVPALAHILFGKPVATPHQVRGGLFQGYALALAACVMTATVIVPADAARRPRKQPEEAAPASAPADKRDRTVAAPGSPFNGRAYWQATAQCGGIYYRLNRLYLDAAATAKVVKPDPTAYARFTKEADAAVATATTFFDASEYFLASDRKLPRQEAMLTYDAVGHSAGDRLKTVDAALQAAKPCTELYKICRATLPQACADSRTPTN
jgi:hypothetical protein